MRIALDEIVAPLGARIVVEVDEDGRALEAWFDLVGLPRVDSLLVGRPVAGAPGVVERLCGLCPAAHHLAGVRALDALGGFGPLTPEADALRRLLHVGSILQAHAPRLAAVDRDAAVLLRRAGKAAAVAAGSPGHFPTTAVPGGVRTGVDAAALAALGALLPDAVAAARAVAEALVGAAGPAAEDFTGPDVALVDAAGAPDLLGERLTARAADGTVLIAAARPQEWPGLVAEQRPGSSAPRPYLTALGPGAGFYRVGPVAQLRVGVPSTPQAADLRERWLAADGGSGSARAVVALHAAEAAEDLASRLATLDPLPPDPPSPDVPVARVGTGWVDGPRGLLVHSYTCDADGVLTSARITTPTAQNEPWLARLLTAAASAPAGERPARLEASVRAADPCLPVSSAPEGAMGLTVEIVRRHDGHEEER